jgi:hypothetical protein
MMGGHDEGVIVVGVGRRRDPRDDVVIVRWSRRVRHEVVDLLLWRGGWAHRTRRRGRPGGKVLEKNATFEISKRCYIQKKKC